MSKGGVEEEQGRGRGEVEGEYRRGRGGVEGEQKRSRAHLRYPGVIGPGVTWTRELCILHTITGTHLSDIERYLWAVAISNRYLDRAIYRRSCFRSKVTCISRVIEGFMLVLFLLMYSSAYPMQLIILPASVPSCFDLVSKNLPNNISCRRHWVI